MKKRYVIYHNTLGVYLGPRDGGMGYCWSNKKPQCYSSAPTFQPNEAVRDDEQPGSLGDMIAQLIIVVNEGMIRPVEVWPDLPDNRASVDACANAQLPRWTT